mmetsp:Transcript_6684/g.10078  ORF Transcript_6684/g.10078 Transcript_6684/m.10078 type:complete len:229 (-) Transcript_6684:1112-1798(-)
MNTRLLLSQPPLFMRTVSLTLHSCSHCLLAIRMACLLTSATIDWSWFQNTYFTRGTGTSPSSLRLCCSKRDTRSSPRRSRRPLVPPKYRLSVAGFGGDTFFVTSFWKFFTSTCRFLSSTANRFLAMNTAARPTPRRTSWGSAAPAELLLLPLPLPLPLLDRLKVSNSYDPPSESSCSSMLLSAGLKELYCSDLGPPPSPGVLLLPDWPTRRRLTTGMSRPVANSKTRR